MILQMAAAVLILFLAVGQAPAATELRRATFDRAVANLEYSSSELHRTRPASMSRAPEASGDIWYGAIIRRVPGEGPGESSHYVPFMVEYSRGIASRAWCDAGMNGDLTDDPPVKFSAYPGPEGSRSFLVDLRWTARSGSREIPVDSKVRVVLEPITALDGAPIYREQRVFAMLGNIVLEGKVHRAVLLDGDGDGIYTKDFADGLFVDLDDDLHFEVDTMSPAFGPFGAPFQMGRRAYEVIGVDPEGRELSFRETGAAELVEPPRVGGAAPPFSFQSVEGARISLADYRGRIVLVYFWASWCGSCTKQAAGLVTLYEKYHPQGVEILGVSYDIDRVAMAAFREQNRQTWPTSFSGRRFWEDPIGRLYQARASGTIYLIDREGRLEGIYHEMEALGNRLAQLMPSRSTASR